MNEALGYIAVGMVLVVASIGIFAGGKAMLGDRSTYDEDQTLDHVPINKRQAQEPEIDWRLAALVEAHRKYGRQFKVGPDGMGEVLKRQPNGELAVSRPPQIISVETKIRAVR